jgi:TRAP transporter TAXI family solute receptor
MTRTRHLCVFIVLAILLAAIMGGCSTPPPKTEDSEQAPSAPQEPTKPVILSIAGGTASGTFYAMSAAISELAKERMPGLIISPMAVGGAVEGIKMMQNGELDIGMWHSGASYEAWRGEGAFAGQPVKELRAIGTFVQTKYHVVTRSDHNINKVEDLKGKKVNVGPRGGAIEVFCKQLFEGHGMMLDDVILERLSPADATELFKMGDISCFIYAQSPPHASITDVMSSIPEKTKILDLEDDKIQNMCEMFPAHKPATIYKNDYPNLGKDIETVAAGAMFGCSENLDEEVVYKFTKAIYDNNDFLVSRHAQFSDTILENALQVPGDEIPLHPGAARYYREKGLIK